MSLLSTPFTGWLADVRLGRYKVPSSLVFLYLIINYYTVSMLTEKNIPACVAGVLNIVCSDWIYCSHATIHV